MLEDHGVLGRVGAEPVEEDALAVLAVGRVGRGIEAGVVEACLVFQPADARVAAAGQHVGQPIARLRVEHVPDALLVAVPGKAIDHPIAVGRGLPEVQAHAAVGAQRVGIQQHASLAVLFDHQHGLGLLPVVAGEEEPLAVAAGHALARRRHELLQPGAQGLAHGQGIDLGAREAVLGRDPGLHLGRFAVLEPAVRVHHGLAVVGVRDGRLAGGRVGEGGFGRGGHGRGGSEGQKPRQRERQAPAAGVERVRHRARLRGARGKAGLILAKIRQMRRSGTPGPLLVGVGPRARMNLR
ncbi:hypothetical protein D3C72_1511830 [compost metagenome]